jgi:hypothetical protein
MRSLRWAAVGAACLLWATTPATAQTPAPDAGKGMVMLTIFLKHDQSKTVTEINEQLKRQGWYDKFPPKDIEIVSWYVMMGIGQVVTLRLPGERLREVNLAVEQSGWGAYRTEFYPTYDFKPVWEQAQKNR